MKFKVALLALLITLLGCSQKQENLKTGVWRGVIDLNGNELPFNFAVTTDSAAHEYKVYIKNAEENLLLDEINFEKDTVIFKLHIFDAELRAKVYADSLVGYYVRNYEKDYRLPFKAYHNYDYRFKSKSPSFNVSGKWDVIFTSSSDTTKAVGLFDQIGDMVTGTFLTPTGDYRFLEGNVAGDTLQLSTFDGNHIYLFKAVLRNDTIFGEHFSGKTGYYPWVGVRNENASLSDSGSSTFLKEGFDAIAFNLPDINGNKVSPTDEKYKGKVLILQLFGTWCPNCLDETRFLSKWYRENNERGVEVIGLAYESSDDFEYAKTRVEKMINKLNVPYDFVIAGTKDKKEASKTLPMLSGITAFPTTIFIGKDGKVKKIHTGFTGPGTGSYYDEFKRDFNTTVNELLSIEESL